jgi:hypothetical protein
MKTQPFTIEGCKANNNEAVTRCGLRVVIVSYSNPLSPDICYQLTGYKEGSSDPCTWKINGSFMNGIESTNDLLLPHTPKLRQWTPEEAIGKVVVHGCARALRMVISCSQDGEVVIADSGTTTLAKLLSSYTQPDGSPCGVEE